MPGLVGIVSKMPKERACAELSRMVRAMMHESFYVSGTWGDPSIGIYVGWVAREGSFGQHMPVTNETGDLTLIFSGEEYPEPDRKETLARKGHKFDRRGPAYLVHQYEEAPERFFAELNGLFQGVLVDHQSGSATIFNDRYGMLRLYGHEADDAFYFAAEAKAIHAVCPATKRVTPEGLGEYLAVGSLLENRTLFEGIQVIPAASRWMVRDGKVESESWYFNPAEWEQQEPLTPDSYYQELREEYARMLPRYLHSDERVALALTGGLDTRLILSWAQADSGKLPCYTFGSSYGETADVRIARRVATECNQSHKVLQVGREFVSEFPKYAERTMYLGEGTIGVGNAQDLFISEKARGLAPAKIVGTWGSELLRCATIFKPAVYPNGLFAEEFRSTIAATTEGYWRIKSSHPVTYTAFHQTRWHQFGIEALEQTQLTVRAPFLANSLVQLVYRDPVNGRLDIRPRLIRDGNHVLSRIPSDRGVMPGDPSILDSLNHVFQEFTFKAEYAFDMGMPQWLAKLNRSLAPLNLERFFLGRHKHAHYRRWYRDELATFVRDVLLDPKSLSRPYLNRSGIEAVVALHTSGEGNYTNLLHSLLSIELLQRSFE